MSLNPQAIMNRLPLTVFPLGALITRTIHGAMSFSVMQVETSQICVSGGCHWPRPPLVPGNTHVWMCECNPQPNPLGLHCEAAIRQHASSTRLKSYVLPPRRGLGSHGWDESKGFSSETEDQLFLLWFHIVRNENNKIFRTILVVWRLNISAKIWNKLVTWKVGW